MTRNIRNQVLLDESIIFYELGWECIQPGALLSPRSSVISDSMRQAMHATASRVRAGGAL